MIVTKEWLNEFINIKDISTDELCKTLTSIGLEIGGVTSYSMPDFTVVGKVLSCIKHPDADKLSICEVDVGDKTLQIVCGASNVRADLYVAVALVGAKIGDLTIKDAKLRGVASSGMICSSTELGLPKLNDGIIELDNSLGELVAGMSLGEIKAFNDDVIEIDLTPNRGDCLSIYGIARELSAYYNLPIIQKELNINEHEQSIGQTIDINCDPKIESSLIYKVADISNFSLPILHKLRLALVEEYIGDLLVDTFNYATYESGVILNFYDIENSIQDEHNIYLFNLKKDSNNLDAIYSKELLSTISINKGTQKVNSSKILIEASYNNPDKLSKQVFENKIKTDKNPYYRTSRGSEPDITYGINNIIMLLSNNHAQIYKGTESFLNEPTKIFLDVNPIKISSIIGQEISKPQIEKILKSLGFFLKDTSSNIINITVPAFRHDISNIADITEEVLRIIGIDNIEAKALQIKEINRNNSTSVALNKLNYIRSRAVANGFFETITYIFAQRDLLQKYGFSVVDENLDILNPISHELNTFRTTMALNLVLAASHNVKNGFDRVPLFEVGSIFDKTRAEFDKFCLLYSGKKETDSFENHGKPSNMTFFEFADKLSSIVGDFELIESTPSHKFAHPYQYANIIINNKNVGEIYKLHPLVAKEFDLEDTFIAELDYLTILSDELKTASSISKFQASFRDLSLIAPKSMQYKQIKELILALNIKELIDFNLVDIYSDEKLGEYESLTLRFKIQSLEKTMSEEEISSIIDRVLLTLNEKLNIGLR